MRSASPVEATTVRRIWKNGRLVPDEEWIPWAAQRDYIVISRNIGILATDAQRQLLADCALGIVFLYPSGGSALRMFLLLQRRWKLLNRLYTSEPRPFAWIIPMSGRAAYRDPRIATDYPATRRAQLLAELAWQASTITPKVGEPYHQGRLIPPHDE
jgi:hypothetical protein